MWLRSWKVTTSSVCFRENKSFRLHTFARKTKVSSYKRFREEQNCLVRNLNVLFNLKWAKINVKHYSKIWELSWQMVINFKLFVDCEWKYTHQTYTLLRLCLIKIHSWLARSVQTRSGLYRNCVMSTASELCITLCTIWDRLTSFYTKLLITFIAWTFLFSKPSLSSSEKKKKKKEEKELPTSGFEPPTLPSDFRFPDWILTAAPPCYRDLIVREYSY